MLTLFNSIYRYTLPGLPLVTVLYYFHNKKNSGPNPINLETSAFLLIIIAFYIGYLIHQTWLLYFETTKWKYDSPKRPVIKALQKKLSNKKIANMWRIPKKGFIEGKSASREIYALWEMIIYSQGIGNEIFDKAKGLWTIFHTNASNALGLVIASFSLLIGETINEYHNHDVASYCEALGTAVDKLLLILIFSFLGFAIFALKAKQNLTLVNELEKNWAEFWIESESLANKVLHKIPQTS